MLDWLNIFGSFKSEGDILKILGTEIMFGATVVAKTIFNDDDIYGFAVIPIDEEKSYLVHCFDTEGYTGGPEAFVYYNAVRNDSIRQINNKARLFVIGENSDDDMEMDEEVEEVPYGTLNKEFQGASVEDGKIVKGIAAFKLDEERTIMLLDFNPNLFVDNAPGVSKYVEVKTDSLVVSEKGIGNEQKKLTKVCNKEVSK